MQRYIFDIETAPNMSAADYLPEVTAPGNYKDPDKIEAYIKEKREQEISKMALHPDFAIIRAIGLYDVENSQYIILMNGDKYLYTDNHYFKIISSQSEKEILIEFVNILSEWDAWLIGWYCKKFDWPVIQRRCMEFGLKIPRSFLNIKKYDNSPIMDLADLLTSYGSAKSMGLKPLSKRYNLCDYSDEQSGNNAPDMNDDDLIEYLRNDLEATYQLYEKMRGVYF